MPDAAAGVAAAAAAVAAAFAAVAVAAEGWGCQPSRAFEGPWRLRRQGLWGPQGLFRHTRGWRASASDRGGPVPGAYLAWGAQGAL
eukprot:4570128-Pyramimonas_sp.AAC.1